MYHLFVKVRGIIICLYVVDLLLLGTDFESTNNCKKFSSTFSKKNLGEADVMIVKSKIDISLTQSHYIEKILMKFNYWESRLINNSFDANCKRRANTGHKENQLEYLRVIRSFMYTMSCIGSDIAFAVGMLTRYAYNPGKAH